MPIPPSGVSALPRPLGALLAPLGDDVLQRVTAACLCAQALACRRALCGAQEPVPSASELAVLDEELARLLAARELFMAWVERATQEQGRPSVTPAQFLRAWSESTGRVIQLLRARRELGGQSPSDALLEAVYAELEAELLRAQGAGTAEDVP